MRSLALLFAAAPALAAATTLQIDPAHSAASFSVKHMMVSTVHGAFGKVSGTVVFDEKDPVKSTIEAKIDPTSIDTRTPDRDNHLKSPDFFDVAKCPDLTFKSTQVSRAAAPGHLTVTGDLTMHCVTRPVTLDVEGPAKGPKDQRGNVHYGASATGRINREEWGLTWNKALEAGGVVVSKEVELAIELELIDKGPEPAKK